MICIGAVIPNSNSCGFVVPVFVDDGDNSKSTYFCHTNEGLINSFEENKSSYKVISLTELPSIKRSAIISTIKNDYSYEIGEMAPLAFTFPQNNCNTVLIGNSNMMESYLLEQLLNDAFPIEAKYKAIMFISPEKLGTALFKTVLTEYYYHLKELNEKYAHFWKKHHLEGIVEETDGVFTFQTTKEPIEYIYLNWSRVSDYFSGYSVVTKKIAAKYIRSIMKQTAIQQKHIDVYLALQKDIQHKVKAGFFPLKLAKKTKTVESRDRDIMILLNNIASMKPIFKLF